MAAYQICMVNLYARENVEIEVQAESSQDAEREALRRYPDNQVLAVTVIPPPGTNTTAETAKPT